MPADTERTTIQIAWTNFAMSAQVLLVPRTDDRPLDQYLSFRDAALALVQSEQFLYELNTAWGSLMNPEVGPRSAQGEPLPLPTKHQERTSLGTSSVSARGRSSSKDWGGGAGKVRVEEDVGSASTVSGSIKDLVENLPPYAKSALTIFKELIDVFKEKD